ncbi:MAG: hydroxylamine reductase [Spirochaetales bacterium]|nr:hydroxylamine reductase [Spirochaetales bacterium]
MSMFCYQCQEAAGNKGCTGSAGVCGKKDETALLQDVLIYTLKGVSFFAEKLETGKYEGGLVTAGLFKTITNANFNDDIFEEEITKALALKADLRARVIAKGIDISNAPSAALWEPKYVSEYELQGTIASILATKNEDVRSLRELIVGGLKGVAAYVSHAGALDNFNMDIYKFMFKALAATTDDTKTVDELVGLTLECGKYGVECMALLDKANTDAYGHPEISEVDLGVRKNPGILISGHDLKDIDELLKQTENTGVDVYTHSEMLAAQYYPAFKKYSHFAGNYGNAWWAQKEEFDKFNGAIVMTSNCMVPPTDKYIDRIFTTGETGFKGVKHIGNHDFSEVIAKAKTCAAPTEIETGKIVGGFAHEQVFALADKVVDAVKTGAIKKFFVMAGCDGRQKSRSYYTDFAEALPQDTVILTAGCAKYRYNKLNLGDIGGIPRVLDAGQCNDSYSLVLIALKLQEIFGLESVNDLPIAYNIAWYEQKAVIVLLALLYLGVKNIHLGPTLPAFLSPNVAKVLVDNFGIAPIGEVGEDLKLFMGEAV